MKIKIVNPLYLFLLILFGIQLCLYPEAQYVPSNMILGIAIGWLLGEVFSLVEYICKKK